MLRLEGPSAAGKLAQGAAGSPQGERIKARQAARESSDSDTSLQRLDRAVLSGDALHEELLGLLRKHLAQEQACGPDQT